MRDVALIATAGLLAYGAWLYSRREVGQVDDVGDLWTDETPWADTGSEWTDTAGEVAAAAEEVLTGAGETAAEFLDNITGGALKISAMSRVNPMDLAHPNVRALMAVIRRGEGTADENGYRRIFGGQLFTSFADHPRITVRKNGYTSTAAGAYQFIVSTWDETRRIMNLPDFSPRSQDLGALGRIVARGALADVKAGRFDEAVRKIAREWASLPGSPYGQPTISWDTARTVYAAAGGDTTTMTA